MCAHMGLAHEAAVFSLRAADAMKKIDPGEAITHYRNAVSLYCELGRFFTAGNIQKGVAQVRGGGREGKRDGGTEGRRRRTSKKSKRANATTS